MVWFIGVQGTVHAILAIKISKKILPQQKFYKILRLQSLISPKQELLVKELITNFKKKDRYGMIKYNLISENEDEKQKTIKISSI